MALIVISIWQVAIHAPGVPPIMGEKGVAVSTGQHNFIAIKVKQVPAFSISLADLVIHPIDIQADMKKV